jgi:hypothetical protein
MLQRNINSAVYTKNSTLNRLMSNHAFSLLGCYSEANSLSNTDQAASLEKVLTLAVTRL